MAKNRYIYNFVDLNCVLYFTVLPQNGYQFEIHSDKFWFLELDYREYREVENKILRQEAKERGRRSWRGDVRSVKGVP